ncbi:FAD-binding oxidoreductase [Actibacterium pelagium]|uniref:Oxidoreductase n=1 Tax=Actibacterium pelagium TaxID=2029103 RepID=A0A917EKI8_9RHOB|nr:FAD-binding oxidoreductase [Actibacterium pelagium]GGE55063.1 oxidoreductase [Actibacterium pelagium]
MSRVETLSGWGRWPKRDCVVDDFDPATDTPDRFNHSTITRGAGRSYGDAAMNPDMTFLGPLRNRFISFDPEAGDLVLQAGAKLSEVLEAFVPRGWFLPVTPGTKFATIAGVLAVDAHGKNHHAEGSFGDHVNWFDLMQADGQIKRCSPKDSVHLFNATIGGMGLTGHILTVSIKLRRIETAWIQQKTLPAANLEQAMQLFEDHQDATYSVAWLDCLAKGDARGRSLIYLGEHASVAQLPAEQRSKPFDYPAPKPKSMPIDAPNWALNRFSLKAFNYLYYRKGTKAPPVELVDYDRYFYPLDAIHQWNRLYGKRGFAQYQCALPLASAKEALLEQLDAISKAGLGSFLAVLKRLGPGAPNRPLSFPIEGYTLALDFPLTPQALTLMDLLDEITIAHGGRLYLAKDSRMTQATFEASYGDALTQFRALRRQTGAYDAFQSLQSRRLNL